MAGGRRYDQPYTTFNCAYSPAFPFKVASLVGEVLSFYRRQLMLLVSVLNRVALLLPARQLLYFSGNTEQFCSYI